MISPPSAPTRRPGVQHQRRRRRRHRRALGAHKVIYLTDVEGPRLDADDPSTLVSEITTVDLQRLVDDG